MKITTTEFISSHADVKKCPTTGKPEFAFIGRSNVGKSSLINMLLGRKDLAKVSGKPGKTQTINHYLVNNNWYLVDLPGYGYAHTDKKTKQGFGKIIETYVSKRTTLDCLFILLDIRLEPQKIDMNFIQWAGSAGIPIALVFTKTDKLSGSGVVQSLKRYQSMLLQVWEILPPLFQTSVVSRKGKEELLNFIQDILIHLQGNTGRV